MVRWHRWVLSCLCIGLCTHNVHDLNPLVCFRNFWNHGTWRFFFVVVHEDRGSLIWAGDGFCLLFV